MNLGDDFFLADGVVYGPIQSRRLGVSLGLNLLPANVKVCGFNCNYCQCGWTYDLVDEPSLAKLKFPSGREIAAELEAWLKGNPSTKVDCITMSGNGEPTLHPDFDGVVTDVIDVRDRLAPGVRLDILTNGALLHDHPRVVGGCNLLDERYVKLDGGTDSTFLEMNSPTFDISVWAIIQGAKRLRDCVVQSMFTHGRRDNTTPAAVESWIKAVAQINPKGVHLYTVARRPADNKITGVDRATLASIAERMNGETGIPAEVF